MKWCILCQKVPVELPSGQLLQLCLRNRKKTILINIFGGILKCDILAEGIVKAAKIVDLKVPLVVRMKGTNAEQGKKILADFNETTNKLKIYVGNNMDEAAQLSVKAASEHK